MSQATLDLVAASSLKKLVPVLKSGMTVRVSQKIREGEKERVQNFEGLIIAVNGGRGIGGTFTVRRIAGGFGVEKTFPLHGAMIPKIQVLKEGKVRRAKLYYMRDLQGKGARLKTTLIDTVFDEAAAVEAEKSAEAAAVAEAAPAEVVVEAEAASAPTEPATETTEAK